MSQPAGWYDDPQDADVLRYWDGVQWTTHTSPRRRPGLGQTSGAQGQGSTTVGQGHGGASHGDQSSAGAQPQGGPQRYGGDQRKSAGGRYEGQQSQDAYGTGWSQSAYGADSRDRTPDGQQLSGWWRRVLARILDGILFLIVTALLIPLVAPDLIGDFDTFVQQSVADVEAGRPPPTQIPEAMYTQFARLALVSGVLALLYEIVLLKVASGTLGKLALGIRVRLRDEPGPLTWGTSAIRGLVWQGPGLVGNVVPLINALSSIFTIINSLWPLWDSKKQSLNDKVAKTNVVRKS